MLFDVYTITHRSLFIRFGLLLDAIPHGQMSVVRRQPLDKLALTAQRPRRLALPSRRLRRGLYGRGGRNDDRWGRSDESTSQPIILPSDSDRLTDRCAVDRCDAPNRIRAFVMIWSVSASIVDVNDFAAYSRVIRGNPSRYETPAVI